MLESFDPISRARARRAPRGSVRTPLAALALAVLLPSAALPASAEETLQIPLPGTATAPEGQDCEPVDFVTVEVVGAAGSRAVVVTISEADARRGTVHLQPYVYVMQPEYWSIGTLVCRPTGAAADAAPPPVTRAELAIEGSIGTRGIEVLGRTGATVRRFDLRP